MRAGKRRRFLTGPPANVKPTSQAADPRVAEALEWPGRLALGHGWDYEVWTGADPVYLGNVRFLAGCRRSWLVPAACGDAVLALWRPGDTFSSLACRAVRACPPGGAGPAVLRLLWEQRLAADLHRPLGGDSGLEVPGG